VALLFGPIQLDTIDPFEVINGAFRDQTEFAQDDIRVERIRVASDPTALAWKWSFTATAPPIRQLDVVRFATERAGGRWRVAGRLEWPEIANGVVLFDPDHGFLVVADTDGEDDEELIDIATDHLEMVCGG